METKTVSELAELFGVTRQAMNKRVKSLDEAFVEKNEKNVTVVNLGGIHELEHLYGKVVTAEAEVVESKPESTQTEVALAGSESAVFELVTNLMKDKNKEIDQLHQQISMKDQQLSAKDAQIAEKDKQLNKQQELMAQALAEQKEALTELKNQQAKGFFARLFGK